MVGLVHQLLSLLSVIVIADALLSWVLPDPNRPPRSLTRAVAEPLTAPVRALIRPDMTGGIDFSPLVVILVLHGLANALAQASGGLH
jgi:YggT family protein